MKEFDRTGSVRIRRRGLSVFVAVLFVNPFALISAEDAPASEIVERARANSPTGEADEASVKPTRDPATWIWSVPDPMPHVNHGVVFSEAMQRKVGYNIYLPPGYYENLEIRYPVVYFLHGVTGTEKTAANMVHLVIAELNAGHIGPVIWVYVNGGQYSMHIDLPGTYVKTETYYIEELIPHIDENYRTIADRSGRAISGWSMGGAGSTRLAMKYPQLFCGVGSLGGAFRVMEEVARDDSAFAWAEKNADVIRSEVGLTFFIGEDDFLYEHNVELTQHFDRLDISYSFKTVMETGHDLGKLQREIGREFVRSMAQFYAPAR